MAKGEFMGNWSKTNSKTKQENPAPLNPVYGGGGREAYGQAEHLGGRHQIRETRSGGVPEAPAPTYANGRKVTRTSTSRL